MKVAQKIKLSGSERMVMEVKAARREARVDEQ